MSKCDCGNEPGLTREQFIEKCAEAWDNAARAPARDDKSDGKVLFVTAVLAPGTRPDIYRTALGGADVRVGLYNIASEAALVSEVSPALEGLMHDVVRPIKPLLFFEDADPDHN